MISIRTCILCLSILSVPSVFASHNAKHGSAKDHAEKTVSPQHSLQQELENYERDIKAAINVYKEKTAKVWGDEVIIPDSKTDVTYRNDLTERSVVDYEEGTIQVEIAIVIARSSSNDRVAEKLALAVADTILRGPDHRSFSEMAEEPDAPNTEVVSDLADLIADDDGSPLAFEKVNSFSKAKTQQRVKRSLTGQDGEARFVYRTMFKLVPDHIKKRARKYRDVVAVNAAKMRIPTPLIYAVMETESFFNPWAKSPVPAFGLMQLVPKTGARDAYRFLHNRDWVVKEKYLYNSNNNIELGVAYMHVLYYKYLEQIEDPTAKLWVMIAAYNTGVINVMRAFAGEYDNKRHATKVMWKQNAMEKINSMQAEQVFEHLYQYLPQQETREYIKKVRQRMSKYRT